MRTEQRGGVKNNEHVCGYILRERAEAEGKLDLPRGWQVKAQAPSN